MVESAADDSFMSSFLTRLLLPVAAGVWLRLSELCQLHAVLRGHPGLTPGLRAYGVGEGAFPPVLNFNVDTAHQIKDIYSFSTLVRIFFSPMDG